jgi:hypothetical protein
VKKRNATRRSFLKAVGAGATALPFYRLLENSVLAQSGQPLPLRFCGIYHPHGIAAEYFASLNGRFSGLGSDTETNFNLTYTSGGAQCVLQPFDDAATYGQSFKSKILPIEGIDLMSNANGHDTAGTILTGSYIEGGKPKNSSLDQYMAVERKLGAATRVTSIAVGVGEDGTQAGLTLSYGPGGAPLPKVIDPVQAFNTLFSGYVPTNDPVAAAAAMRTRAKGRSIIDFVVKDIARINPRLAAVEQQKLQQHLDSIRDMEKQFAEPTTMMGTTCMPPPKPDAKQWTPSGQTEPKLKRYNGGEPYFDVITNAFIDVLTQAFACDITRFATFYMADLSYSGNPLGLNADNHGAVAHTYNGSQLGNDGHPVGAGDAASWIPLAKFNRYSYGKIALFMQKLAAAGVLDNVLIYASSDMGNPSLHSTRNAPTVLAGGAAGTKFRMGRRLKMAADCMTNLWCSPTDAEFKASTNNHILVSIAQAFGLTDVTSFGTQGTASWKTGTLTGLL